MVFVFFVTLKKIITSINLIWFDKKDIDHLVCLPYVCVCVRCDLCIPLMFVFFRFWLGFWGNNQSINRHLFFINVICVCVMWFFPSFMLMAFKFNLLFWKKNFQKKFSSINAWSWFLIEESPKIHLWLIWTFFQG